MSAAFSSVNSSKPTRSPKVKVDLPDKGIRKYFTIGETNARILDEYTSYLSEHHGRKVDEDKVIESLIETLKKDKTFKAWRKKGAV